MVDNKDKTSLEWEYTMSEDGRLKRIIKFPEFKTRNNHLKPFLHVYIYQKGFPYRESKIIEWRQKEIDEPTDINSTPCDKRWTWRLLEKACRRSLKKELNDLHPHRIETKRVVIDSYYISMSNSGSYVMVAISSHPVGVDIQRISEMFAQTLSKTSKIWNPNEIHLLNDNTLYNFKYWARKEALYKMLDPGFVYKGQENLVDITQYDGYFIDGDVNYCECVWSIASELIANGVYPCIFKWPEDK